MEKNKSKVNLIFPHQLFSESKLIDNGCDIYLIEEYLFFRQYKFHKQKIAFHRASMKAYQAYLESKNRTVVYIDAFNENASISSLLEDLIHKGISEIQFYDIFFMLYAYVYGLCLTSLLSTTYKPLRFHRCEITFQILRSSVTNLRIRYSSLRFTPTQILKE